MTSQTCGCTASSSVTARRSNISLKREHRSSAKGGHAVMSFRRLIRLGVAIIASAVAGCTAASDALAPNAVSLATGIPGGVYHPVGNAICRMFNLDGKHQETPCIAMSSDGSVENIRRVESVASAFGLSQTDVPVAPCNVEGPFAAAAPAPKLRTRLT